MSTAFRFAFAIENTFGRDVANRPGEFFRVLDVSVIDVFFLVVFFLIGFFIAVVSDDFRLSVCTICLFKLSYSFHVSKDADIEAVHRNHSSVAPIMEFIAKPQNMLAGIHQQEASLEDPSLRCLLGKALVDAN